MLTITSSNNNGLLPDPVRAEPGRPRPLRAPQAPPSSALREAPTRRGRRGEQTPPLAGRSPEGSDYGRASRNFTSPNRRKSDLFRPILSHSDLFSPSGKGTFPCPRVTPWSHASWHAPPQCSGPRPRTLPHSPLLGGGAALQTVAPLHGCVARSMRIRVVWLTPSGRRRTEGPPPSTPQERTESPTVTR
jgi:hypothetical protein